MMTHKTGKKAFFVSAVLCLSILIPGIRVEAANISNSPSWRSAAPRVAVDSGGNVHVVWVEFYSTTNGDIFYARFSQVTQSWSAPQNISNSGLVRVIVSDYCCDIAADGSGRVYAVWSEGNVVRLRILSGGAWDEPHTVVSGGFNCDSPRVAVTPGGNAYVAWWTNEWRVYSRARIDGNWEPNARLISVEGKASKFADIALGNNFVGACWVEKNAALDIYQVAYSQRAKNSGSGWSSLAYAAPMSLSQQFPVLELDSTDSPHVVWTTVLSESGTRVVHYVNRAGAAFSSPQAISPSMLLHYPAISETGGNLYASWQVGGYGGGSSVDYNTRVGGNWSGYTSVPASGGSTFCDIASNSAGDGLYIVWDSYGEIQSYAKVIQAPNPNITLTPERLYYTATTSGVFTRTQYVYINRSGSGAKNWTAASNQGWLRVTPGSGAGSALIEVSVIPAGLGVGSYSGTISVTDPDAPQYAPKTVSVTLTIIASAAAAPPFGAFDTPSDGSTVSGSIAVTGWALDDIDVKRVEIKREPDSADAPSAIGSDGLVYIGEATFIPGSRPDVAAAYPAYPRSDWAGWGYMMLTHGLPRKGNGTFRLHAIAEDATGLRTRLGIKTITSDNARRVKPFGTLDTPGQAAVLSGTAYWSFGWALTPPPNMIPADGSTIWLTIDSAYIGHPVYNQYRADIASAFPECLNANGAVGAYQLDTTKYANGAHTIGWLVTDNGGNVDGMGSRFIAIQNTGSTASAEMESLGLGEDASGRMKIEVAGENKVEIEELERLEISLIAQGGNGFVGWGTDRSRPLPIGSTLDKDKGIFSWAPAAGFLGRHVLHFAVSDGQALSLPVRVEVTIFPKKYEREFEKKKAER